jgi:hypothetical protein
MRLKEPPPIGAALPGFSLSIAAQRISSLAELEAQLRGILQGASRSILAKGGTQLGAALEALNQTDVGRALLERFAQNGNGRDEKPVTN